MKGMVFTEFLEMVEDRWSPDLADDLVEQTPLASGGRYTAVGTYDHTELVSMVRGLSERIGVPVPDLVQAFGRHLFGRFVVSHPAFFVGVTGALDFLERIEDVIHVEVLKLYPDATLPRFDVARSVDRLVLVYRSSRHFEDLAHGLILGCLDHYGEAARVSREPIVDAIGAAVRFEVVPAR
jgi:hypothetical protein